MKKFLTILLFAMLCVLQGCAHKQPVSEAPAPVVAVEPADDEIVVVTDYIPDISVDLKYATEDNFTGEIIYTDSVARLRYGTVKKLMQVQAKLSEYGFGLLIWDAYRPVEAQYRLWEVCPNPAFVANPNNGYSSHSRGNTVDVTLVCGDLMLPMPSDFDEFNDKADRDYSDVWWEAADNARTLESVMEKYGFEGYDGEWWHYTDTDEYPVVQ